MVASKTSLYTHTHTHTHSLSLNSEEPFSLSLSLSRLARCAHAAAVRTRPCSCRVGYRKMCRAKWEERACSTRLGTSLHTAALADMKLDTALLIVNFYASQAHRFTPILIRRHERIHVDDGLAQRGLWRRGRSVCKGRVLRSLRGLHTHASKGIHKSPDYPYVEVDAHDLSAIIGY
jgi:hypothetical protein